MVCNSNIEVINDNDIDRHNFLTNFNQKEKKSDPYSLCQKMFELPVFLKLNDTT